MFLSGAEGDREVVLFEGDFPAVEQSVPALFATVIGSFLELIASFYRALIRIDSHIYSRSSWSFTSKQSELVTRVFPPLVRTKYQRHVEVRARYRDIDDIDCNSKEQKHELIKEKDHFNWLMNQIKGSKADWVYISNCHRL
jgi:hypothetical protein